MLEVTVQTQEDVNRFLEEDKEQFFDAILVAITEGWKNNDDIVRVAEFHILEDMHIMSIDMDRADWLESLALALDFYEEIENYEACSEVKFLIEEMG
jgi:hypothetical protein